MSKNLARLAAMDLRAPGAIENLIALHRANFGTATMEIDPAAPQIPADSITVNVPATPPAQPQGFDEEAFLKSPAVAALLASVRKEEKDKLYPTIEGLKTQVADLTASKQAEIAAAAEQARKDAEEQARKTFEESTAKDLVAQTRAEFEAKMADLQRERDEEKALREKESAFNSLRDYAQSKVKAALDAGSIAPELAGLVTGNSAEEIDASLAQMQATTEALVANMQQAVQQVPAVPAPRGVSPTGFAAGNGPMEQVGGTRTLSAADIQNMSLAEYAKLRPQLGTARESAHRGLFG
ncbi:hypothetical protein [Terracoccus sp. 273MFTsu3.1]|uniref:hypothetical protein n=1 Tax=Terracoccus sp. 273MFTsu3.1 TaxID=1172188 RepID=UPI00037C5BBA|nr:hypothetical protein [Terracoccus sp. 273MFTsu3.1]